MSRFHNHKPFKCERDVEASKSVCVFKSADMKGKGEGRGKGKGREGPPSFLLP